MTNEGSVAVIVDRTTARGVTIEVSGDIDARGAEPLTNVLERAATSHPGAIEVNLSGVRFLSIAGLQPVLIAQRRWPGRVTVSAASDPVRRLFSALGLAVPPP